MPSAFQVVLNSLGQTSSTLKLNLSLCICSAHWVLGSNPLQLHCFLGSSACSNHSPHALQGEKPSRNNGVGRSSIQLGSAWETLPAWEQQNKTCSGNKCPHIFLKKKNRERVSLHKRKQNKNWVMDLCWCYFSSAARRLENMLVFRMVFKVGIWRFLFCISKSGVLCVLLFRLHGQTTHFPVCLHHICFVSAESCSRNIRQYYTY